MIFSKLNEISSLNQKVAYNVCKPYKTKLTYVLVLVTGHSQIISALVSE